jgi:poly-gamma-glutamate synthesis protein (capsule biosynthesis protein)
MTPSHPTRRGVLGGATALAAAGPVIAAGAGRVRVALLGQALIQYDLRSQAWPDRDKIARLIGRADVGFTNLETVINGATVGRPTRSTSVHLAEPAVLDCLKSLNVSLVTTSNNHAFDLGAGGVVSTLKALDAAGLPHAGSGLDLNGAAAPAFRTARSGKRVAVVGFATGKVREGGAATPTRAGVNEVREDSPGVLNADDLARVFAALKTAAAAADAVIAYQHNHLWGDDMAATYPWQRDLAKACVDAGASAYVAHGAPLLHGMEIYRNAPLFYGLGNFMFQSRSEPGAYPHRSWDGLIVDCKFEGGVAPKIAFTPLLLNDTGLGGPTDFETRGRPSLAGPADAARILADFAERSRAFGVRIAIRDGLGTLSDAP